MGRGDIGWAEHLEAAFCRCCPDAPCDGPFLSQLRGLLSQATKHSSRHRDIIEPAHLRNERVVFRNMESLLGPLALTCISENAN